MADQLSYIVQKFSAAGAFEAESGSTAAGAGQFGRSAASRPTQRATCMSWIPATTGSRSSAPRGNSSRRGAGAAARSAISRSAPRRTPRKPPGGGIACRGDHVYVADSGNNRIERFNLEGGEPLAWGTTGAAPAQFSYPRAVAANESEVIVSDDDNHRIEKFSPEGGVRSARPARRDDGPGQFGFPYGVALDAAGNVYVADDSNDRVVKLSPQLASRAPGAAPAPNRASWTSRARWRAIRRATPTWRTPPTSASRCSTPSATTCARSASPPADRAG